MPPSLDPSPSFSLADALSSSSSTNLLALSVSLTFSSSSSLSSLGDVPLFSSLCKNPYKGPSFLTLAFDELKRPVLAAERGVVVSVPTAPRLAHLVLERRSVTRWTGKIDPTADGLAHGPWADPPELPEVAWIPQGSVIPRSTLLDTLHERRERRSPPHHGLPATADSPSKPAHKRSLSAARREAQVFGTEISLPGHAKAWSRDVSPDPTSAAAPSPLRPPTLIVSTSTAFLPISLSTSSHTLPPPVPLAVRRGKKQLAPLNITKPAPGTYDEYPGMPTAFRSPACEPSASPPPPVGTGTVDMRLDEMIADLRARAAALPPGRDMRGSAALASTFKGNGEETPPPSSSSDESGGWATLDSVLEAYHAPAPAPEPSVWDAMLCSPTESSSSASSQDQGQGQSQLQGQRQGAAIAAPVPVLPATPRLPKRASTPPRPARLSDPPKRGILKTAKVVRFTDPPAAPHLQAHPIAPRNPSPLRQSVVVVVGPTPGLCADGGKLKFARRSLPTRVPASTGGARRHTVSPPHAQFMQPRLGQAGADIRATGERYPRASVKENRPPMREVRDENAARRSFDQPRASAGAVQGGKGARKVTPLRSLLGKFKA